MRKHQNADDNKLQFLQSCREVDRRDHEKRIQTLSSELECMRRENSRLKKKYGELGFMNLEHSQEELESMRQAIFSWSDVGRGLPAQALPFYENLFKFSILKSLKSNKEDLVISMKPMEAIREYYFAQSMGEPCRGRDLAGGVNACMPRACSPEMVSGNAGDPNQRMRDTVMSGDKIHLVAESGRDDVAEKAAHFICGVIESMKGEDEYQITRGFLFQLLMVCLNASKSVAKVACAERYAPIDADSLTLCTSELEAILENLMNKCESGYVILHLLSEISSNLSNSLVDVVLADDSHDLMVPIEHILVVFQASLMMLQRCLAKFPQWFLQKLPEEMFVKEILQYVFILSKSCQLFRFMHPLEAMEGQRCVTLMQASLEQVSKAFS